MKYKLRLAVAAAFGALAVGCATVVLVPGADKVRLTSTAADVAPCNAVGNVSAPMVVDSAEVTGSLQNQAVGLGANAVLITGSSGGTESGVAYHCP